jgi:hypothetical protein
MYSVSPVYGASNTRHNGICIFDFQCSISTFQFSDFRCSFLRCCCGVLMVFVFFACSLCHDFEFVTSKKKGFALDGLWSLFFLIPISPCAPLPLPCSPPLTSLSAIPPRPSMGWVDSRCTAYIRYSTVRRNYVRILGDLVPPVCEIVGGVSVAPVDESMDRSGPPSGPRGR